MERDKPGKARGLVYRILDRLVAFVNAWEVNGYLLKRQLEERSEEDEKR